MITRLSERRFLTLSFILSLLVFLGGCEPQQQSADVEQEVEQDVKQDDPDPVLTGCPPWEERTDRYTKKLICAGPGGHICTPDNAVCLEIPALALDRDTELTLTVSGAEFEIDGVDQLNPGAQLEPSGLTFRKPVTAIVRTSGVADVADVSLLLASASDQYEDLDNIERNPATGQIKGELDHFSWLYPYLVGAPGPGAAPTVALNGQGGANMFGGVGSGGNSAATLRVVIGPSGAYQWSNGTATTDTLVMQVNFPAIAAGQTTYASLTMEDPGPYTGHGRNARQDWRMLVFNKIFRDMLSTPLHPTGSDGAAVYPTRAVDINWAQLPVGYPSGRATIDFQFFDVNNNQIGTSTLVMSVVRP